MGDQEVAGKEAIRESRETSLSTMTSRPSSTDHQVDTTKKLGVEAVEDAEAAGQVAPEAPYTIFSSKTKALITFTVSMAAMISPLAATLYYPSLNPLARELHVTPSLINLSITTYMVCQAIAPAIVASFSDVSGRRIAFIICFTIFLLANIGLALQTNYAALMVLRGVQSSGSSSAIALAIAIVVDISTTAERGKYLGYATGGILVGPAIGPVIGGLIDQYLGWRAIFWFLAIFSGVFLVLFVIFFPETGRNIVGNGSVPAKGVDRSVIGHLSQRKYGHLTPSPDATLQKTRQRSRFPNPLLTLRIVWDKESAIILLYNGLLFCGSMLVTASLPSMLASTYHYSDLEVGLCFLPFGFGALVTSIFWGHIVDLNFRRHAKKVGMDIRKGRQQDLTNFPIERARLEIVLPNHFMAIGSILAFGWLMQAETSIAGPLVFLFCVGFFVTAAFNISNTLLIDLHRETAASATAAVNLVRCLTSAGGVAAIVPVINAIGRGWAYTIMGAVYIALTPALWVLVEWGPGWRKEREEKKRAAKEEKQPEPVVQPTAEQPISVLAGNEDAIKESLKPS